ncbi:MULTISPECIES: hypothetical protein [unclassified Mesorhizobium]|uniref:hypothetical protein n=1 Tax=unclassified Mesorhizobium TaxID=325217 RepID=UPI00112EF782|nr:MULTISPECIES: hypothetical protein [unclassified Mesorhizobium]MBZ9973916.1 hypothetical protein [Mesorhizobium sp. BR-1-1-10]TPK10098.1 hypothetical protein FJ543_21265 [Mesorhizobium sp. B2-5-7]
MSGTVCRAWFCTTFYWYPDEASHRRITGFVQVAPVVACLQRLDGRQSISNAENSGAADPSNFLGKECRARLGQVGTAAGVIAHSFSGNHTQTLTYATLPSSMPNRVKCQFGRFFQKFMPPERQLSKTLRKQNSHTGWNNGVPFLTAGKLPRTSDRQSCPIGEFSKKREQCPVHGRIFIREPPG